MDWFALMSAIAVAVALGGEVRIWLAYLTAPLRERFDRAEIQRRDRLYEAESIQRGPDA